jgi:hypothetical protein
MRLDLYDSSRGINRIKHAIFLPVMVSLLRPLLCKLRSYGLAFHTYNTLLNMPVLYLVKVEKACVH